MSTDDQDRQGSELEVFESIFNDERLFVRSKKGYGGQLSVTVNLPENIKILHHAFRKKIHEDEKPEEGEEKEKMEVLKIQYLPPITMNFNFPSNYPSETLPNYTLSCKWLTVYDLSKLCKKLDELWFEQQGNEILYEWYQMLTDDTVEILKITSELKLEVAKKHDCLKLMHVDKRAVQDIASVQTLVVSLMEYNELEGKRIFMSSYINCGVCFDEKLGSSCVRFPQCKHTYCSNCMKDYFTSQINDGAVKALTCPEEKCTVQADPGMVKTLVEDKVFEKYDKILLQRTLDCMSDIAYCPRQTCQSPVLKEQDQNMGRCPACNFVFCIMCKTTYHGAMKCPVKSKDLLKIREIYFKGEPAEREELEQRYGKRKIQSIIEEGYSEEWLDKFTESCPGCRINIQKFDGCNKMTCFSCRTNFCWICLAQLEGDPYEHFNNKTSKCHNKLFEGMAFEFEDSEDEDDWINLMFI